MSNRRNNYPNTMEAIAASTESPVTVAFPPYGRLPNFRTFYKLPGEEPQFLPDVIKRCGYCGVGHDRRTLTKLPNGLFICPNHPDGEERDKMSHIA